MSIRRILAATLIAFALGAVATPVVASAEPPEMTHDREMTHDCECRS